MTKADLVKYVKDSFWLDLAYDEEDRNIITEKGLTPREEVGDQRTIPPLPDEEEPSLWFESFKRLKLIRVLDGLDLDKASREYADANFKSTVAQFQQGNRFNIVRNGAEQRRKNLDKITWKCSAAIDKILGHYESQREDAFQRQTWATLLALYHSELCASASAEVSFGWARRQAFVLKKEAVGLKIFRWISNHNVSRGYNHLKNPLNAVKGFDFDVDTFNCDELLTDLRDEPEGEIRDLLFRLLYMPAILTLAQSLGDLQRHSERRYYLNKGKAKTISEKIGSSYWSQIFSLQLSLTEIDIGFLKHATGDPGSNSQSNGTSIPPRTKSLSKREEIQRTELKMRADFRHSEPLAGQTHENWLQCTTWLHLWHSAEPLSFHAGLQTTAEFLVDLLKLAKKSAKKNAPEVCKIMEMAVKFLIETRRFMAFLTSDLGLSSNDSGFYSNEIMTLKYLLGNEPDPKPRDLKWREIWNTGSRLLECLKTLDEVFNKLGTPHSQEMAELDDWNPKLGRALNWPMQKGEANSCERQFRSEIGHLTLFPQSTTRICDRQEKICDDNCFIDVMNKTMDDPKVAKLPTYKRAMNSQQERFLSYLKPRTAKDKSYRLGESKVKSPDFELISLRRWNSFSPNLGSRAAASVGGGYLVRLWQGDRYVGIAVDPGYNYLENLFNEGFTIADIDIVVVTHAHPDHTENLTNLFTLLFERNKRMADEEKQNTNDISAPIDHRIFLLITEGVFERYQSMLPETKAYIRDVVVLKAHADWPGSRAGSKAVRISVCSDKQCRIKLDSKPERAFDNNECVALIQAKRAWHDDLTGHDSIGIVVTYRGEGKRIGILGDSKYHEDLYHDYKDCSVLIAHLGSLISKSSYKAGEENSFLKLGDGEEIIKKEGHLYLPGLTRLICDLKNRNGSNKFPLMVLSEFGEELRGGLRKDLAVRLAHGLHSDQLPIVPADVGLRIDIEKQEIFCSVCHNYFDWKGITAESVLPHEEALAFVCDDCRLLRAGELPRLLEDWCTTGRPVIPLNIKSIKLS